MPTKKPRVKPQHKVAYRVLEVESERGWGQNHENVDFKTEEKAKLYAQNINKRNTATVVPDYYVRAEYKGPVAVPYDQKLL